MSDRPDILHDPTARRIALGMAFVLVLLGVGFATYLLGDEEQGEEPVAEEVSLQVSEGADRGGYELIDELVLEWGPGDDQVAVSAAEKRSTLDTVFLGPKNRVYVVDHPSGRVGARVRWWDGDELVGVYQAPGGSTLFTADGDGFAYVIAKGIEASERIVVVDAGGKAVATFTVPLRLNSGGIVRSDDTLYARAAYSELDPDADTYMAKDILVPVAIDGKQATDDEADEGAIDAWTVLPDGVRISKTAEGTADENSQIAASLFVRYGTGPEVEVPIDTILLGGGVEEQCTWLLLPPRRLDERGSAGWPALFDSTGAVVRMDPKGEALSVIAASMPRIVNPEDLGWAGRVSTDGERLIVALGNDRRVTIQTFGRR